MIFAISFVYLQIQSFDHLQASPNGKSYGYIFFLYFFSWKIETFYGTGLVCV